jgi:hypothetical protein
VIASNKPYDEIRDQYTPECPICKGVLLPEKVMELEAEVRRLMDSMEQAWVIIANSNGGDWEQGGQAFFRAATGWRSLASCHEA